MLLHDYVSIDMFLDNLCPDSAITHPGMNGHFESIRWHTDYCHNILSNIILPSHSIKWDADIIITFLINYVICCHDIPSNNKLITLSQQLVCEHQFHQLA